MPRKKSVRIAAERFVALVDSLETYYSEVLASGLSAQAVTWGCEAAIVKLSVRLEHLMLHALVGAINNDTSTLAGSTGIPFPKHLTDEVCEFIVTGGRYFDFRGRDGLIKLLHNFVPEDHYLLKTVKKPKYRVPLERLFALRNFAAHESRQGKVIAAEAVSENIGAAGAWIKRHNRFLDLSGRLKELAKEIRDAAPY
jgi:hypothetical protein